MTRISRSDFIKPFARSTGTKQGRTLVLITATGEEMVLEQAVGSLFHASSDVLARSVL